MTKNPVLKVPRDTDWKALSESRLREWLGYFDEAPATGSGRERQITHIETLVGDGETVVTQAYESEPGMFVFTTITPTLKTLEDESTVVHVDASTFEIGINGAYKTIATLSRDLRANGLYAFGQITPGRIYNLQIAAKPDTDSPMIKMHAQGSSDPIIPPLPFPE